MEPSSQSRKTTCLQNRFGECINSTNSNLDELQKLIRNLPPGTVLDNIYDKEYLEYMKSKQKHRYNRDYDSDSDCHRRKKRSNSLNGSILRSRDSKTAFCKERNVKSFSFEDPRYRLSEYPIKRHDDCYRKKHHSSKRSSHQKKRHHHH